MIDTIFIKESMVSTAKRSEVHMIRIDFTEDDKAALNYTNVTITLIPAYNGK